MKFIIKEAIQKNLYYNGTHTVNWITKVDKKIKNCSGQWCSKQL
jgi:hypothetical protein